MSGNYPKRTRRQLKDTVSEVLLQLDKSSGEDSSGTSGSEYKADAEETDSDSFDEGMCDSCNSIPQSEAQCKKVVGLSENIKSRFSQFALFSLTTFLH